MHYETIEGVKADEFYKKYPNPTEAQRKKFYKEMEKYEKSMPPSGTAVNLYRYDPLSVKPWDMLTDAEKKVRVEKYGTDGVPKSYIDKLKPEDKQDKEDKIDKQRPKIEALQPLTQQGAVSDFSIDAQLPVIRPEARIPKSFDVNSQRQTMSGPSDYYNYSDEGVDFSDALRAKESANKYNQYVQEKYKEAAKTNPKAQKRLEQLMQNVELTPNYQMGGSVYPVNYVPQAAMGASMPGAVGFTYARTKGIPSNGPYAKKTMASAQNGVDMYDNPLIARMVNNANIDRSYYDPRLNTINMGSDYNMWRDEETGEPLTGEDLKYQQDKMLAHENYHAMQHKEGRDNYDIAHSTDNEQWARMQKRPEVMSTDAVWNNFYNRSAIENIQDYANKINEIPEARLINQQLLFDKVLDRERYNNPSNLEGEAKFYEDTGVTFQNGGEMKYYQEGLDWKPKTISKNGGWLDGYEKAQTGYTTGDKVTYGTPEYTEAYNKGEVVTDEGVRSPIALDEVVIQNNYRRPRGFWEQYADKIVEENKDAGLLGAIIGTPISAITSLPQLAMMKGLTGEMQRPSEAMDIENPYGAFAVDAVTDPANLIGVGELSGLSKLTKENALAKLANIRNIKTSVAPELTEGLATQGFPNPLGIVDKVVPRPPTPGMLFGMEDSWNNYSPLNLLPFYGKKLSSSGTRDFVGFRKFGNSIDDVIESQSLRPKGTGMGSKQIMGEGNWAEPGRVNENYSGVFEATMNPNIEGSNIKLEKWRNRNGIVGTTQEGDVAIPLTDPGLSFNRRLPFSNKYIPIDKERLINNKFQLATQLPYAQSLAEKYGLWAGLAGGAGYISGGKKGAQENIDLLNKYTVDPIIEQVKPYYDEVKKEVIRQSNIKKQGGIIKDDRGQWDHPGEITEIGSNEITMEGVPYPVLGISDEGDTKLMKPGKNYKFKGKKVTEYPMAKNGLRQEQKGLVNLDNLLNFTNYNKPQPGGWLDSYK